MLVSKQLLTLIMATVALAAPIPFKKRSVSLTPTANGRSVILGDIAYYVPNKPEASFATSAASWSFNASGSGLVPLTLVKTTSATIDLSDWDSTTERFASSDDVWSSSFLGAVIFTTISGSNASVESNLGSALASQGTSVISTALPSVVSSLPEGPYFLAASFSGFDLYKAYRMYLDDQGAFFYGLIQDDVGNLAVISASHPATDGSTTIAVPSRLYYAAPTEEKPLNGVRLGVKDLYNLKGLKTSMGNRAWTHLYAPVDETAVAVQRLIDLGAVVVGKTRLSQFANGESPTADWVDYHDPFNPRGDGYMDPSSSSSGAGAAEGSYDWIDMNVGSDTGGSVRAPAGVTGLYGNRPSQGAIDLTGALSMSPEMDTAAFIARTASSFANWGKAWYGGNPLFKSYSSFPNKIIYPIDTPDINTTAYPSPGFFPSSLNASQPLYDTFVAKLESLLGVNRTTYDFYTEYKETSGTNMYPPDHVGEVWTKLTTYEQARDVWPKFFADYAAANDGDMPHLDPPVKRNYIYGTLQTPSDLARILDEKAVFQNWTRTQLLTSDFSSATCSNAIFVNPIIPGANTSRETYPTAAPSLDNVYLGWNRYGISQLAGVPEVVLPLGEVPFLSPVTNTTKHSPVAVSLLAGYGCDFMLFDLVEKLAEIGAIPAEVEVGASMY